MLLRFWLLHHCRRNAVGTTRVSTVILHGVLLLLAAAMLQSQILDDCDA
jgi:hypothetical protein